MPNENVNKVIFGGRTLIDLTGDDVVASDVQSGKIFHLKDGSIATGTSTFDADTSDATAVAAEILQTKTAYKDGSKLTGTMPNNGAVAGKISSAAAPYTVPRGYHDGSGTVDLEATEKAKLIADNIREGVTILGVAGTMSGSENVKATSVTVTPYTTAQTITPADSGDYNSITQVNVAAIAYNETDNAQGGKTVTIGTVAPS